MAEQLQVNSYDLAAARAEFFSGMGLDAKRPTAWSQYGYPEVVTFEMLRRAYDRGGLAQGAVHRILDKCWETLPRIKSPASDDESPWETKLGKLLQAINGWQKLRDFDRRNMVGHFAALIYRVADSRTLDQPMGKASRLVDIVPVYEDQIRVTRWQEDSQAEDYGKPLMFQIRSRSPASTGDTQAKPEVWLDLHPSRVQILAEGSVGDFFEGVPLLRAGFNDLVDIEKIKGGSAEGFLKNSARTLVFKYERDAAVQAITTNPDGSTSTQTVREVHEQQTKALNRNQDASIVIQGGDATALQTSVADPQPSFDVSVNSFAASVRIPVTILCGQQTGRLASDEDKADMNARCASRQANELTPMLTEFVMRMQAAGLIEAGEFEIEWPDLGAPTDEQKLDRSKKMAETNKTIFDGGGTEPAFDAAEIRKAAGYEEREGGGDEFKEDEPPPDPLPGDPAGNPVPAPNQ